MHPCQGAAGRSAFTANDTHILTLKKIRVALYTVAYPATQQFCFSGNPQFVTTCPRSNNNTLAFNPGGMNGSLKTRRSDTQYDHINFFCSGMGSSLKNKNYRTLQPCQGGKGNARAVTVQPRRWPLERPV